MEKYLPKVNDKLYIRQKTDNYWVDSVKRPYTVIEVNDNTVIIQACKLIFNGPAYYDTLPDKIEADPNGKTMKLRWSDKKQRWQESPTRGSYPYIAVFGSWEFEPYLN